MVEGVFLGMVSKAYEYAYSGIVLQAVLATCGVFFVMALLYRSRAIRATPRFNEILFGCLAGAGVLILGQPAAVGVRGRHAAHGNGPIACCSRRLWS